MKVGRAARDIFSATAPPAIASDDSRHPATATPSAEAQAVKATVVLRNGQIVALDRLSSSIRSAKGISISRAEILRAMIDALLESGIELTESTSESDMRARIARAIKTPRHKDGMAEVPHES